MTRLYIWERPDWPRFTYESGSLLAPLALARQAQGRLLEAMGQIGFEQRRAALLETLTTDAVETSKIEGELLNYDAVRSSVAVRLGIPIGGPAQVDARSEGIAAMTLDATENFDEPLTAQRLFAWHRDLFPNCRELVTGQWRSGPVGVYRYARVDAPPVEEYFGPPADRVPAEMSSFLAWFNEP
ncbi:MAG: DUF4172 domain-containing protein, partial [Candidatus Eremiobacteraeota bacterium]|nr:DUF4172 domain-containing protein [Candidatus Eremiobacteraeota bacterium]